MANIMKILAIMEDYPWFSGIKKVFIDLLSALIHHSIEDIHILLVCIRGAIDIPSHIPNILLPQTTTPQKFFGSIYRSVKKFNPDVILVSESFTYKRCFSIPVLFTKKFLQKPFAIYFFDAYNLTESILRYKEICRGIRGFYYPYLRAIHTQFSIMFGLSSYNIILVGSDYVKYRLIKKGFNPDKIKVVGTPITVPCNVKKLKYLCDLERPIILNIGRVAPDRRPYDFIKVAKSVKKKMPTVQFTWIGSGELLTEMRKKAERYVNFMGRVSENIKFKLIRKSCIFAFTGQNFFAGFNMPICEALLCGTPVVSYRMPLLKSLFKDEVVYVPFGNVNEMSLKIIEIIENYDAFYKSFEKKMANIQHTTFFRYCNPQKVAQRTISALTELLKNKESK